MKMPRTKPVPCFERYVRAQQVAQHVNITASVTAKCHHTTALGGVPRIGGKMLVYAVEQLAEAEALRKS